MKESKRLIYVAGVALLVIAINYGWGSLTSDGVSPSVDTSAESTVATSQSTDDAVGGTTLVAERYSPVSDLPLIGLDQLPAEAIDTMTLIYSDGPFPYDKDGSVFQNREGLLPDQDRGYYREYTVDTPGASNRGARRIVGGAEGEQYYTSDHYASFAEIEQ